jgi:hypothetical protein
MKRVLYISEKRGCHWQVERETAITCIWPHPHLSPCYCWLYSFFIKTVESFILKVGLSIFLSMLREWLAFLIGTLCFCDKETNKTGSAWRILPGTWLQRTTTLFWISHKIPASILLETCLRISEQQVYFLNKLVYEYWSNKSTLLKNNFETLKELVSPQLPLLKIILKHSISSILYLEKSCN